MSKVKKGDVVVSFDFPELAAVGRELRGENAAYYVGVVEAVGPVEGFLDCDRYTIKVLFRVASGRVLPDEHTPDYVFPPVNGTPKLMSGGVTNGVVKMTDLEGVPAA